MPSPHGKGIAGHAGQAASDVRQGVMWGEGHVPPRVSRATQVSTGTRVRGQVFYFL